MPTVRRFTVVIYWEGDGYVALCPQVDIASQGATVEEARTNLTEALTLFLETADASESDLRSHFDVFVTQVDVPDTSNFESDRPRAVRVVVTGFNRG